MNRHGNGDLPRREMVPDSPARTLTHAEVEAQIAEYLARGGQIHTPVAVPLRCVRAEGRQQGSTDVRWASEPPAVSRTGRIIREKRLTLARRRKAQNYLAKLGAA